MAHYDFLHSDASAREAEPLTSFDALIRPNFARAFPLPAMEAADDERFRLLLDAISACGDSRSAPRTRQ